MPNLIPIPYVEQLEIDISRLERERDELRAAVREWKASGKEPGSTGRRANAERALLALVEAKP